MVTVIDSTSAALDALHDVLVAAMPALPAGGADDQVGVVVLLGPDQDRTAVPRVVTIAAAFNVELDPLTVAREESGYGRRCTDTIAVMCSVLVQGSPKHPDRDFAAWRRQASVILEAFAQALRAPAMAAVAARARVLSTRWYDAYDGSGGGPMAVVVDVQVELVVLT